MYYSKDQAFRDDPLLPSNAKHLSSQLLKVACQSLLRDANSRVLDLRREHNAEVASARFRENGRRHIHNLPYEIFSDILLLVRQRRAQEFPAEVILRLQPLLLVGKCWKNDVLLNPRMWTYIHHDLSPTHLQWCIQRSGGCCVEISCHTYGPPPSWTKTDASQSFRWRSLAAHLGSKEITDLNFLCALESHASALRDLDVMDFRSSPRRSSCAQEHHYER